MELTEALETRECVFCRIVAGVESAAVVRRWPDAIALVPLGPVVAGHLLVVPVEHVRDVTAAPEVAAAMMRRAATLAVPPCNIITSAGAEATQSQFHAHLHVLPRAAGDGLMLPWTSGQRLGVGTGTGSAAIAAFQG